MLGTDLVSIADLSADDMTPADDPMAAVKAQRQHPNRSVSVPLAPPNAGWHQS